MNRREVALNYYEDIEIGRRQSFGHYDVTREEVLEFANKYDPQAFHLDDEAAAKTHFGRISASGWHTCAMTMAMMVENMKNSKQAGLGSLVSTICAGRSRSIRATPCGSKAK